MKKILLFSGDINELTHHLRMNGYVFTYQQYEKILEIDENQLYGVKTILDDRDIPYMVLGPERRLSDMTTLNLFYKIESCHEATRSSKLIFNYMTASSNNERQKIINSCSGEVRTRSIVLNSREVFLNFIDSTNDALSRFRVEDVSMGLIPYIDHNQTYFILSINVKFGDQI